MLSIPVTFCLPDIESEARLEEIAALVPDRDWQVFGGITNLIWVAQTFLRLRDAGHPVQLSRTPPEAGIVVIEASSRKTLSRSCGLPTRPFIVAARADHRPQVYADAEIVQNDAYADDSRVFWVPHWPQPGLIPRDPSRGDRLERISFKGHSGNLHADFEAPVWQAFLRDQGLHWDHDSVTWHGKISTYGDCSWNDFSSIDLVLAVRWDWNDFYWAKPASKLVNAWHAGAPAILGPEYAYTQLRKSELDYLEVRSVEETMQAVKKLKNDPQLYQAMIKNGLERAQEVSVASVTERWAELLFDTFQPAAEARSRLRLPGINRRYRRFLDWNHRMFVGNRHRPKNHWREKGSAIVT